MSDPRSSTRSAQVIVALAAGLVLLGATAAANAKDTRTHAKGDCKACQRPSGVVTVSNGVATVQIRNGPGGVAIYSGIPGTITVSNGTQSKTLSGGTLTLSGDVTGVAHARGIQVGARNRDGNVRIALAPPLAGATQDAQLEGGLVDLGDDESAAGAVKRVLNPATEGRDSATTVQD